MQHFKKIKMILILILLVVLILVGKFYLTSKFDSGQCIQALDGYIWHINKYKLGKYDVMGWQGNSWGNEVSIDKDVLERKNLSKIPEYHYINCPVYSPI